jgi:hypothetical protein
LQQLFQSMVASQTSGSLLRVNSNAVLVVPPFECAWLQGPENIQSGCCVSFDVKGELHAVTPNSGALSSCVPLMCISLLAVKVLLRACLQARTM